MRFLLTGLLTLHGLIHLLGFVSAWGLADIPRLGGISRGAGLLWLAAALALLTAGTLALLGRERWWIPGALGVVLSQALIVSAWTEAKAGTALNVVLVVPLLVGAAQSRFRGQGRDIRDRMVSSATTPDRAPSGAGALADLPPPVQRWLRASGALDRPRPRVIRLHQRGQLRTAPDQAWMPARAEQHFTVDPPGFVWAVDVRMARALPVVGRDTYEGGRGRMLIKAGGLVTVADGQGPATDQGTMLRYLGEIVWFPTAAQSPHVRWEPVDDHTARATMSYAGVTATANFTFDERGRMVRMTADRYMGAGADAQLTRWEVVAEAWEPRGGVLMPVRGVVSWHLPAGRFDYYRWEITDLEFDPPALAHAPATRPPLGRPITSSANP